jgi:aryl-alcohol dehydrogenase-like predicted oxidoreductase
LADFVRQVGREKGATPSQIALAWLLHQGEDIVPIPGTKRRKYLEENLGAASMKLSPEELQKIASFLQSHTIAGQRYAASDLARVNG